MDGLCPINTADANAHQVVASAGRSAADKQQLFRNVDQQAFLNRYVHALLSKNPRIVWRFTDIMNMVPRGSTSEEVIQALIPRAHLVHGCWIACSALRCNGNVRLERMRDMVLLQFSRGRRVRSEVLW